MPHRSIRYDLTALARNETGFLKRRTKLCDRRFPSIKVAGVQIVPNSLYWIGKKIGCQKNNNTTYAHPNKAAGCRITFGFTAQANFPLRRSLRLLRTLRHIPADNQTSVQVAASAKVGSNQIFAAQHMKGCLDRKRLYSCMEKQTVGQSPSKGRQ